MANESEEFIVKKELEEKRANIQNFDQLTLYLHTIKNNYNAGYGIAPRAIAQATLATAWFLSKEFGITGFQAEFVMWDFIRGWDFMSNQCGLRIIDYDNMLYPQYKYKFEKTICVDTWEALQKRAKELLMEREDAAHPVVIKHWKSIVDGNVPFGYEVEDDA